MRSNSRPSRPISSSVFGPELAREVAARDRLDALLQPRQRREHALRPEGHADADQRARARPSAASTASARSCSAAARSLVSSIAAEHGRPAPRAGGRRSRARARADRRGCARRSSLSPVVERGVQLAVAALALLDHRVHAPQLAAQRGEAGAVVGRRRHVLDVRDAVERAVDASPGAPCARRSARARVALESRSDSTRSSRLPNTDCVARASLMVSDERQVALVHQAQRRGGALVLRRSSPPRPFR